MNPAILMTEAELARLSTRDDAGYGALATARGALPLTAMTVDTHVLGLIATIEVTQTFENTLGEAIEATYIFPLPDRAAVTRFRMEVAGRVIEGVIDERGAARMKYDAAIAAGHRAAITEEERAGVFALRVGNLMPRDRATVRLSLTGPLPVEDGEVTFRFPLVVAPRYIPGRELPGAPAGLGAAADTDAVPDASRISPPVLLPGVPNPVRLAMKLVIDPAGVPIGAVRSSLHAVNAQDKGGAQVVELSPGERLDRDFIVRWSIGDDKVRSSLVWAKDPEGQGATFLLTLVPPRGEAGAATRPRDVVFVLDRSGSMNGWKMVCARRAVARMVDTLGAADRFAVLAFDNAIEEPALGGGLTAASDRNRFRAVEFLAGVDARGGTELAAPLARAATLLAGGYDDRDRVLVLVTDGQVGNEDQILRELAPRLRGMRVFTLGIDQAVNAAFLRRFAAAGGGACELCESEDRLDDVMDKVHRRIGTPVVTELALDATGVEIDRGSLAPHRLPALFAGAPVVVGGRLARAPECGGTITISGRTPAGAPWREPVVAATEPVPGSAITAAWARARIRDLEDQFAIGSCDQALVERELVSISTRFRVLSRFTAFVAVDKSEVVNAGGGQRQIVQAVEHPAGWANAASATRTRAVTFGAMPVGVSPSEGPLFGGPPAMPPGASPVGGAFGGPPAMPMSPRSVPAGAQAPITMNSLSRGGAIMQAPAPPQPSSPTKTMMGGGFGRPSSSQREAEAAAPSPLPPIDDAPYRDRARAIADALDAADAAGDGRGLDLAVSRLAELVEDLRSVGGLEALAVRLTTVLEALRAAATKGELVAAAATAAPELRGIAGAPSAPTTGGGPGAGGESRADRPFWKFWK